MDRVYSARTSIREIDIVGRVGGEEFAVILPHTSADGAVVVAERVRAQIEGLESSAPNATVRVTVSIGLSCRRQTDASVAESLGLP